MTGFHPVGGGSTPSRRKNCLFTHSGAFLEGSSTLSYSPNVSPHFYTKIRLVCVFFLPFFTQTREYGNHVSMRDINQKIKNHIFSLGAGTSFIILRIFGLWLLLLQFQLQLPTRSKGTSFFILGIISFVKGPSSTPNPECHSSFIRESLKKLIDFIILHICSISWRAKM
jgi:hypothetical protein